jgi:hypothetical protein
MIAKLAFYSVLLFAFCSCTSTVPGPTVASTTPSQPVRTPNLPFFIAFPDETNAPAVAVYVVRWSLNHPEPQLISALWADGRIVWSQSRLKGGPPYRKGRYDPPLLNALVNDWERHGVFGQNQCGFAVPDAALTNIEINHQGRDVRLVSSHELLPPDSIPQSWQGFYDLWSKIRADLGTLIPQSGEPYGGSISHNR